MSVENGPDGILTPIRSEMFCDSNRNQATEKHLTPELETRAAQTTKFNPYGIVQISGNWLGGDTHERSWWDL
jgi:hypothetical protein